MNRQSNTILNKIKSAANFILDAIDERPSIGIISGTGLESLSELFIETKSINVTQIPYFPSKGASERWIISGKIEAHRAIFLNKRLHFYEGFSMSDIAFVVRVFKKTGIAILIITNAAGGINPSFSAGDIMLITDHINLMGANPLIGENIDELGPRFPDMTSPYDPSLINLFEQSASKLGIYIKKGVYVGVSGPSLETRAETRFLRMIGADAVGMSTIPEVVAAVHCGIRVLGVSVLSNINLPDAPKVHTIDEIIHVVKKTSPILLSITSGFFKDLPKDK